MSLEIGLGMANFMSASLPELIDLAARHGFPTITVRPSAFVQALGGGLNEKTLRRRFTDAGVRATLLDPHIGGLPGVPPPETMDPAMRAFLRQMRRRVSTARKCWSCR